MNKTEFLRELNHRLSGLDENDLGQRLAFYDEIIEDYKADGVPEEEAVARIGTVDEIVDQVMAEIPLTKLVAQRMKSAQREEQTQEVLQNPKTGGTGKIVALILTFPLWFPFLIVLLALIFTFYVVLWALMISLFAVDVSLLCGGIIGFLSSVPLAMTQNTGLAALTTGAGFLCVGLFMILLFLSLLATKGVVKLGGGFLLWIKSLFIGREGAVNA